MSAFDLSLLLAESEEAPLDFSVDSANPEMASLYRACVEAAQPKP